jgi:protein-tyrosine phosphatase
VSHDDLACNTLVRWERALNRYAKQIVDGVAGAWKLSPDQDARRRAAHHALGYLVRAYFDQVRPDNMGVVELRGHTYRDARGRRRPLLVFRSGLTIDDRVPKAPSRCFESLVRAGRVRHVINLYGGTFPFYDVVEAEKASARALGISYVDVGKASELQFRRMIEKPADYSRNRVRAMRRLATLIRRHLLRPGGAPPRGNIYVHCGGGMHRTGMLVGVLRKCINEEPMAAIEAEYRRHTDYRSEAAPGGFEPLNLKFIEAFDCSLLQGEP